MGIGLKIKEYRTKAGLTQKDLADELHVTYQAVSRWENDDAEPSFDILINMCKVLNCTTDDLFEINKPVVEEKKEEPQVIERVIIKEAEQKPLLGVCEQCNKTLYDKDDLFRWTDSYPISNGRSTYYQKYERVLCKDCYEIKEREKKQYEENEKRRVRSSFKARRIHSIIWPSIVAIIILIASISSFVKGEGDVGGGLILFAIMVYSFLATVILNNTFITDLWLEVASWGFVKMPGIIFSFSIDGFIFLIAMKILFFILGMLLSILAVIFATVLALALSLFVYPVALIKNIKGIE